MLLRDLEKNKLKKTMKSILLSSRKNVKHKKKMFLTFFTKFEGYNSYLRIKLSICCFIFIFQSEGLDKIAGMN